jgi:type IV pilus assembly protein PilY1
VSFVIDDVGPVTAAISKLQDRRNGRLWLYFGTGRYFYKMGNSIDDPGDATDSTTIRRLYGVQEPCYSATNNNIDGECSLSVNTGSLQDQSSTPSESIGSSTGWYINLDTPSSGYSQERLITDPLAVFSGVVFFTTYSPSADICAVGGNTYVWAVNYKSGSQFSGLSGKALVQVSTGEIKELNLASAFSERDNRRSAAVIGVPPKGQGLSILIGPRPLQKVLHIQEK